MFKRMKKAFVFALLGICLSASTAFGAAQQVDFLLSQIRNSTGSLAAGTIYFYSPGTTTLKTVWTDLYKTTAAANPYTIDSNGTAQIYADGLYKIVIKNAAGTTVYTRDNLNFWAPAASEYYACASATDQGVSTSGGCSIASLLTSIGTSKQATIVLAHSGSGNTTIYTVTTPISFASYPHIRLVVENGAVISGTVTGLEYAEPEWWNVTGTADNVPISAALAAASVVKLQPKTYNIAAPIIGRSGTSLIADNWAAKLNVTGTTIGDVITLNGVSNVLLQGFKVEGNANTNVTINIYGTSSNVTLDRLNIIEFSGAAVGIGSAHTGAVTKVRVTNSELDYVSGTGFGVYIYPLSADDLLFEGNRIISGSSGIGEASSTSTATNVRIVNNYIKSITDSAVVNQGTDSDGWKILGNHFTTCGISGVVIQGTNDNWLISGNTIESSVGYGIHVEETTALAINGTISNNIIRANGGSTYGGIYTRGILDKINITGNTVQGNYRGIYALIEPTANLKSFVIANNLVTNNTNDGIFVNGNGGNIFGVQVLNNTVTANDGMGIRTNAAHRTTIRGNTVMYNVNQYDIYAIDPYAIVENNVVLGSTGKAATGIYIGESPGILRNNVSTGHDTAEMVIYKSGVIQSGNVKSYTAIPSAASATDLVLGVGDVFLITGATQIESIKDDSVGGEQSVGRRITLIFESNPVVVDGNNLKMAGNFSTSADDTLTLQNDGTNWFEVARSAN